MEVADVVAEKSTDKAEDLNNTIKEIISDIDREIGYQENVGTELLQQKDSPRIENDTQRTNKQQTQHSTDKNNLENSELQQRNENTIPNQLLPVSQPHTEGGRVLEETNSKSEVLEETSRTENGTLLSKKCNIEESSTISKEIDLQKILTPAQDVDEILPKNRKLYASSAFYSPDLHPTVEDQVELARRISHSLSDISNQQSKGQSMYVNRMKSSVKWVHEGPGKENSGPLLYGCNDGEESKENTDFVNERSKSMTTAGSECTSLPKVRLKLVMNPRGQIRDFNSVRDTWDTGTGLMSPDKCAELVNALNAQKGKGAELFAKRRRKAEKWVVDETNAGIQSPSGVPDYHQYQPTLPANTDAGKRRVEQNFHQEPLNEKSVSLGLKTPSISQYMDNYKAPLTRCIAQTQSPQQDPLKSSQQLLKPSSGYNCKRDLAYRPNIPQGWKAENFTLPKVYETDCYKNRVEHDKTVVFEPVAEPTNENYLSSLPMPLFSPKVHKDMMQHNEILPELLWAQQEHIQPDMKQHLQEKSFVVATNSKQYEEHHRTVDVAEQLQQLDGYKKHTSAHGRGKQLIQEQLYKSSTKCRAVGQREQQKQREICELEMRALTPTQPNQVREREQQYQKAQQVDGEHHKEEKSVAVSDLISIFNHQTITEFENNMTQQHSGTFRPDHEQQQRHDESKQHNQQSFQNYFLHETQLMPGIESTKQRKNDHSRIESNLINVVDTYCQTGLGVQNQELYIPKEIPLESYAPPPTMATSLYDKSAQPLQNGLYSRSPAHLSTATPMRFPASESAFSQLQSYQTNASLAQDQSCGQQTQYHDSFPTTTNSMVGARNLTSHPPKQLHLAPNSYQTVPQETSHVPPLSFNPSQLRYDKLAKFENPSSPSSDGPSCRHSSYRTVSMPAAEPRMRKHSPVPKFYNNMADQSSPLAHQQSCHHAPLGHHFNSTKLLRCQNFNNAARGWNPSGQAISRNNDVVVVAGNLPYTDF